MIPRLALALILSVLSSAAFAQKAPTIEKLKAQNAKAKATNSVINDYLKAANAGKWDDAAAAADKLIQAEPGNWQFHDARATAAMNLGKFDDAAMHYGHAIDKLPAKLKNRDAALGRMLTNRGNAYIKLKKMSEAVADFEKAAAIDPHPATAYFNLCATQYNAGNVQGALSACDKAIAADPKKADAYFIKGSLLLGDSKIDAQGKMAAPAGTVKALNKYLELQPNGPHAPDVKEMLKAIGAPIETTYSRKKAAR